MAEDRMLSDEVLLALIKKNSGGGGGADDYNDLKNQPQIGGVTLIGNKTASDLGLVAAVDGKGLSTNDYTDNDKAIVGGVTAALAGKQGALTAGDYISIDAQNSISVNRDLVPHQTSYRIKGTGRDTMNITKYIDGVQESSTDYVYSQGTTHTIDDAFTINDTYSSAGYIWQFVWLKDSTTHDKDYTVEYRSYEGAFDFTEVFNDEDLSGYKLVIKSELDAALANKQDKTDNNLQTTDKTVVGAINEHEGDIDSLKSGLTNVDVALSVPENTGKNLIPLSLDNFKTYNTDGTWSSNVYSENGIDFTVNTDASGAVTSISASGTASATAMIELRMDVKKGAYTLNGCPSGGSAGYYLQIYKSGVIDVKDRGNGAAVNLASDANVRVGLAVGVGLEVTNLTFYPMLRLATITDPTFAPYIPSVESRIEAVDFGILPNAVNYLPSVTIDVCQLWKNGKVVNGNIKFTTSETIASGNFIISGMPKISTSAANAAAMGAVSFNKNGAFGGLANTSDGTYGAVFLTAELSAGTYCASFSYISA